MGVAIRIQVNDKVFIRDPQDTKLGQSIVKHGILLLDELGLEEFTFKKLANRIESTEASIYRYFENKHLFLVYILCWYWERMRYLLSVSTKNITNPEVKLRTAISIMVESSADDPATEFIDETTLFRIVLTEGSKTYHTKHVDEENRQGFYKVYKELTADIAQIILQIKPDFIYPKSLATSLLEMANFHTYAALHLPSLTEVRIRDEYNLDEIKKMLEFFAFGLLKPKGA
jgi:AcrR family transcriptional regulator